MNNLQEFLKGTEYTINRKIKLGNANAINQFRLVHGPSNAYLNIANKPNYIEIKWGETPKPWRGIYIGTELRALAAMYAIFKGKPIKQSGINVDGQAKLRTLRNVSASTDPTSTYIVTRYLGWNGNKAEARFTPGVTNNTRVRKWANNAKKRNSRAKAPRR